MKKALLSLVVATVGMLVVGPLQAGVKVTTAPEPLEKAVAFRGPDGKYVSTVTGGFLSLTGDKIGSKQKFTLIDLNGTDPADGDPVKIRYTPGGATDPAKNTFWAEVPEGIKRNYQGSTFKIKLVDGKYALQAPSGKFMTGVVTDNIFGLTDKAASALLLEFVDISGGVPKKHKDPAAAAPAAPSAPAAAPEKPAAE